MAKTLEQLFDAYEDDQCYSSSEIAKNEGVTLRTVANWRGLGCYVDGAGKEVHNLAYLKTQGISHGSHYHKGSDIKEFFQKKRKKRQKIHKKVDESSVK